MTPDEDVDVDERMVRPYTLTGGRTHTDASLELPLEALVRATEAEADQKVVLEHRRIVELCAERLISVAEIAATLMLPIGVARVLIGDLAGDGLVTVHHSALTSTAPADQLTVLESVLSGISQL